MARKTQYSSNNKINALVCELLNEGWHLRRGKHWVLKHPANGLIVQVPMTPSCPRSFFKFRMDVEKVKDGNSPEFDHTKQNKSQLVTS